MGEMKYQRRVSCAATATCDAYLIKFLWLVLMARHGETMPSVAGGGMASLSRVKEAWLETRSLTVSHLLLDFNFILGFFCGKFEEIL